MRCIDGSSLRPDQFNASLNFSTGRPYLFVNVPKAGNFTIKKSLVLHEAAAGNEGVRFDPERVNEKNTPTSPWFDYAAPGRTWADFEAHLAGARLVTNIRNPYTRVLSAYLDKIARRDGNPHRRAFCAGLGLEENVEVGFKEFLALLATQESWMMDGHWCPQADLVHPKVLRYDHFIRLENLEGDLRAVLTDLFGHTDQFGTEQGHRTDAALRLEQYYDAEAYALVREIYREDFRSFGYSKDPADATRLPTGPMPRPETTDLATLRSAHEAYRRFVGARAYYDLGREFLDEENWEAAELLMQQAVTDNPYDLAHYRGWVNALKLNGQGESAARALAFMIGLHPFQAELFEDAVELDLRLGDGRQAINHKVSALWIHAHRDRLSLRERQGFARGDAALEPGDPLVREALATLAV